MKNKGLVFIIVVFAVVMLAAPLICGPSTTVPKVLKDTWVSEEVSLTFSGRDEVKAVWGDKVVEGTYINGTTGTYFVIWMDLGEECPEELQFLESTREDYLIYAHGEDETGEYMEIDGVKYYKEK